MKIIVAFPKIENAKKIKSILQKNGFDVVLTCTKGSMVIDMINKLDSAVVVCSVKLVDMHYTEFLEYIPRDSKVVLFGAASDIEDNYNESIKDNIVTIKMPLRTSEFVETMISVVSNSHNKKKKRVLSSKGRSVEDKKKIDIAKKKLMQKNGLTEEEAYRYIQKNSMDNGLSMVETAEKICMLL